MPTFDELLLIADEISCPPYEYRVGCKQCIQEMLAATRTDIRVHPTIGAVANETCDRPIFHTWFVQACLWRTDCDSGEDGWGYGSQLMVVSMMSVDEIVRKFFVAARDYAEHEVREAFEYRGRKILGPHIGVHSLWEVC